MFRSLAVAALIGAFALPAAAATTVKINVSGLDARAAHASIVRAAKAACQIEMRDASTFEQHYLHADCINSAVAHAQASLDTAMAQSGAKTTTVAGR
jgi:UrcA family protein